MEFFSVDPKGTYTQRFSDRTGVKSICAGGYSSLAQFQDGRIFGYGEGFSVVGKYVELEESVKTLIFGSTGGVVNRPDRLGDVLRKVGSRGLFL
jgi:hypothetical protein